MLSGTVPGLCQRGQNALEYLALITECASMDVMHVCGLLKGQHAAADHRHVQSCPEPGREACHHWGTATIATVHVNGVN